VQLGMIGMTGAGKTTVFEALTGSAPDPDRKQEYTVGTVSVPDERIDRLSAMFNPRKTIYTQVQYVLPHAREHGERGKDAEPLWKHVRHCDALVHVVRNFADMALRPPTPIEDFKSVDQELVFADLVVVEKRLERIDLDSRRGRKIDAEEKGLLEACREVLENELPLRRRDHLATAPLLRGYTFLSAKPSLVLFNNSDEDTAVPEASDLCTVEACMAVRGKLEQELAQMPLEEARAFREEFDIPVSAMERVIQRSYDLLGLVSFFTVLSDEVHAWTIPRGTPALEAAEVIHSDMKRGFIRAEVLAYERLMEAGSLQQAKKEAHVRLEGKTYEVQDGDIIAFRFNV